MVFADSERLRTGSRLLLAILVAQVLSVALAVTGEVSVLMLADRFMF